MIHHNEGDDQQTVLLEITAKYNAFSLQPGRETDPIPYNISMCLAFTCNKHRLNFARAVVNTLYLGLPLQVWKLAVVLVVVGLVVILYVAPMGLRMLDAAVKSDAAKQY